MAAPVSLSRANLVGMMPTPRASLKQPAFAHVCSAFLLIALLSMQLAQFALNQLQSWIREVLGELSLLGEGLEAFTNSWDHLLAGISVDRPDDNMLCALFYEQLCEFRCLELDMPLWDRDDSVRNYAHLRTICVNAITTCRRRRNQEKMYFATRRQGNCGMLPLLMAARVDRPHDLNEVPALVDDVTRGMADVPVSLFAETWRSSRQTHKKVGGKKNKTAGRPQRHVQPTLPGRRAESSEARELSDEAGRLGARATQRPSARQLAAWLLLLFCAAPRANYLLRILPPHLTADYAVADDAAVARVSLRSPPAAGLRAAQLPVDLAFARPPPIAMPRIGRLGATQSGSSAPARRNPHPPPGSQRRRATATCATPASTPPIGLLSPLAPRGTGHWGW
eukprot:s1328_g19.t2